MFIISTATAAFIVLASFAKAQGHPPGWKALASRQCAVDKPTRIFASAHSQIFETDNTPEKCTNYCNDLGYRYAGVEYGKECWCGVGYDAGFMPTWAPPADCNKPCTGDPSRKCGGDWRISLYENTAPAVEPIPAGWSKLLECAVDDGDRIITDPQVLSLSNNTPENCINECSSRGLKFAGIEYGSECICGTGIRQGGVVTKGKYECDMACAGSNSMTCGAGWRIEVFKQNDTPPAANPKRSNLHQHRRALGEHSRWNA